MTRGTLSFLAIVGGRRGVDFAPFHVRASSLWYASIRRAHIFQTLAKLSTENNVALLSCSSAMISSSDARKVVRSRWFARAAHQPPLPRSAAAVTAHRLALVQLVLTYHVASGGFPNGLKPAAAFRTDLYAFAAQRSRLRRPRNASLGVCVSLSTSSRKKLFFGHNIL